MISAALERLATCLCAQLVADDAPPTCFCGVLPGAGVAIDLGECDEGCGMAYVRLMTTYPSSVIGVADQNPGNCGAAVGIDVEIGIYRCFPLTLDGSMPTAEVLLEVGRQQTADVDTIRTALQCCDWLPAKDIILGQYTPIGPEGGVIGGSFQVFAQVFG